MTESIDVVPIGAVIYTDGSCRPTNPGKIGWGCHGYLYRLDPATKPTNVNGYTITNKGYKALSNLADTCPVDVVRYIDGFGSYAHQGTNNRAELLGVISGLNHLKPESGLKAIHVLTDSQYVKQGMEGKEEKSFRFKAIGASNQQSTYDNSGIPNLDLWKQLYDVMSSIEQLGIDIAVSWVEAHVNILGNVQADLLASVGTNHSFAGIYKEEFTIVDSKGYWKNDIERHPFINHRRIYFNSLDQFNCPGHYYQADPGGKDFIVGKRLPEAGYSVIRLSQPDEVIESVKRKQYKVSRDMNSIFIMKLDRLFDKLVYPYVKLYNEYSLNRSRKNMNLIYSDNISITTELNPTGLSLRAIESFNYLEEMLDKFEHMCNTQTTQYEDATDTQLLNITDVFYESIEGKKGSQLKLKDEYIVGYKELKLKIYRGNTEINVPLVLGLDTLPRNNLKKLEELNPSVYLLTWSESSQTMRYATCIKTNDAIGIWSNFFASTVFIKTIRP